MAELLFYYAIAWWLLPAPLRTVNALHFAVVGKALRHLGASPKLRFLFAIVVFFAALALGGLGQYENRFGPVLKEAFRACYQTDRRETIEYALQFVTPVVLGLSALVAFGFFRFKSAAPKLRPAAAVVYLVFTVVTIGPLHSRFSTLAESYRWYRREERKQIAMRLKLDRAREAVKETSRFDGTLVVVIGESLARRHLSLYGYPTDTTPWLRSRARDLLVQRDTISPETTTVEALLRALVPEGKSLEENLVTTLRRKRIRSFWLSNQNESGILDNPVAMIGKEADDSVFVRKTHRYDEALLPHLKAALEVSGPKVIFLHLYAPHYNYVQVVPPEKRGRLKDEYDNAVLYVDEVLRDALALVDKTAGPTAFLLFSDHGEAPELGTAHNPTRYSAHQVEIPHVWYFNEAGKRKWKKRIDVLSRNLSAAFSTESLFPTLLDFIDEKPSDRSLFSEHYSARPRLVFPDNPRRVVAYD